MNRTKHWTLDERAESVLQKLQIDYEYKIVELSDVDIKESLVNRARPKAINQETVEDYAKAFSDGDRFPAVVLASVNGRKDWLIAGGNHRTQACLTCGIDTVLALCVSVDEIEFDALCKSLNSVEGMREGRHVRVLQAVDLVQQTGATPTEAAAILRVSTAAVTARLRMENVRQQAMDYGILIKDTVPQSTVAHLSKVQNEKPVFTAMAKLLANGNPTPSDKDLAALTKKIKQQSSEAEKLECVEEFAKCNVPVKKGGVTRQQFVTLMGNLSRLENQSCLTLKELQITPDNTKELAERWKRVRKSMNELVQNALSKIDG